MTPQHNNKIEIVGLNYGNKGRSCGLHPTCCGSQVKVGMWLKVRKLVEEEEIEEQIQVKTKAKVSSPAVRGKKLKATYKSRTITSVVRKEYYKVGQRD